MNPSFTDACGVLLRQILRCSLTVFIYSSLRYSYLPCTTSAYRNYSGDLLI